MRLLTSEMMRAAEQAATEHLGIPAMVLMENAASAVAAEIALLLGELKGKRAVVFCGGGNNGGDGFAVSRKLINQGMFVRVFCLNTERLPEPARANYQILLNMGVKPHELSAAGHLNTPRLAMINADIVVDALFGTGLKEPLAGVPAALIKAINESGKKVVSVDIPSGLCADRGICLPLAVKAFLTVTLGFAKTGLILPEARPYVGRLTVADISLGEETLEFVGGRYEWVEADFCRRYIKPRAARSHKGDYGHVLVIAGSALMPGAAALTAAGTLRAGAGLVTAAAPEKVLLSVAAHVPEATLLCLPPESISKNISESLSETITAFPADALVIGPGISRGKEAGGMVKAALKAASCPVVIDADALFFLKEERDLIKSLGIPVVMTPHPGEFARLTGLSIEEIEDSRIGTASAFACDLGVTLVLKGSGTVTADPAGRVFINSSGNPGMATGGSGDVLAGVIAAFLGQKLPPSAAAAAGVFLHGLAGDIAAKEKSETAMTAGDIARYLPQAVKTVLGGDTQP